jgi:hypothetical protein
MSGKVVRSLLRYEAFLVSYNNIEERFGCVRRALPTELVTNRIFVARYFSYSFAQFTTKHHDGYYISSIEMRDVEKHKLLNELIKKMDAYDALTFLEL